MSLSIFLVLFVVLVVIFFKYIFSSRIFKIIRAVVFLKDDDLVKDEIYELSLLSAPEIIKNRNYPVEIHKVTTEDGYILEMHRIPGGKNGNGPNRTKSPVFMMHGLQGNCTPWILQEDRLAYQLADLGYDVWLGNARGTNYSRAHRNLDPNSSEFWNFSIDEIGFYDLPAMIDHILAKSGHKSLYYIGSSQGTATSYILLSKRPEYNEKMRLVVSFTPVLCLKNTISFQVYGYPVTQVILQAVTYLFGEMGHNSKINPNTKRRVILAHQIWKHVPENVLKVYSWLIGPIKLENIELSLFPIMLSHIPSGCSYKQLKHFGQLVRNGVFGEYLTNLEYWTGKIKPYNLKNITAPIALFYCKKDNIVTVKDAEETAKVLPNVVFKCLVSNPDANHADHLFAKDADETHYKFVKELFNKY